jgi:hypothetical protein
MNELKFTNNGESDDRKFDNSEQFGESMMLHREVIAVLDNSYRDNWDFDNNNETAIFNPGGNNQDAIGDIDSFRDLDTDCVVPIFTAMLTSAFKTCQRCKIDPGEFASRRQACISKDIPCQDGTRDQICVSLKVWGCNPWDSGGNQPVCNHSQMPNHCGDTLDFFGDCTDTMNPNNWNCGNVMRNDNLYFDNTINFNGEFQNAVRSEVLDNISATFSPNECNCL